MEEIMGVEKNKALDVGGQGHEWFDVYYHEVNVLSQTLTFITVFLF